MHLPGILTKHLVIHKVQPVVSFSDGPHKVVVLLMLGVFERSGLSSSYLGNFTLWYWSLSQTCHMERRFTFSSGVVGLAARVKDKQAVVADGNGTISCIAVKVSCCRVLLNFKDTKTSDVQFIRDVHEDIATSTPVYILGQSVTDCTAQHSMPAVVMFINTVQ